jgi:hypothetical protein
MDTITSSLSSIGIDIAKENFHTVGFNAGGKIAAVHESLVGTKLPVRDVRYPVANWG